MCLYMGRLSATQSFALNAQAMQGEMSLAALGHRIKTSFVAQAFPYLHSVTPCFVFHGAHVHVLAMPTWNWLATATAPTAPEVDASHTTVGNLRHETWVTTDSTLVSGPVPSCQRPLRLTCAIDPAMACLLRLSQDCDGGNGTTQTEPAVCQHRQHDLAMPALPSVSFCRLAEPELNLNAERRLLTGLRQCCTSSTATHQESSNSTALCDAVHHQSHLHRHP